LMRLHSGSSKNSDPAHCGSGSASLKYVKLFLKTCLPQIKKYFLLSSKYDQLLLLNVLH
jgi:hypothetical protein